MKNFLKKQGLTIFIALFFLAGLAVFLYPVISDYINAQNQTRAVVTYHEAVYNLDDTSRNELWEAAHAYNAALRANANRFRLSESELAEYSRLLRVTGSGVMGTLEIPAIGVNLPIYHGTDRNVLQVGVGHLEGSSLPVGGLGSHAVVTGHRGLPSSTLLTDLDRLEIGDVFYLHVLTETLAYEVDQIRVVLPEDYSEMGIASDRDYCTLLTCTPYGINSHRLLVRGSRVEYSEAVARAKIMNEARPIPTKQILVILLVPALVIVFFSQLISTGRKKK
jgi:sortase A